MRPNSSFVSTTIKCLLLALVLLSEVRVTAAENAVPPPVEKGVDFTRDVQPIFTKHCLSCHGEDEPESGLRLDRRGSLVAGGDSGEPAVIPNNGKKSYLVRRVLSEEDRMPPEGPGLAKAEIAVLQRWIDQGAKMPEQADPASARPTTKHWSFQPILRPSIPQVQAPGPHHPIDAFLLKELEEAGLAMSSVADKVTRIRRLYLDMHGLPPTPEEVRQFVEDTRENAWQLLVEKVLDSPRYGERWAQHWLDVVRYADTHGFEVNTPRDNAWPYRDYVIAAFNDDKPYDQFVFEQLAGDTMQTDAATGFLMAGPALLQGQVGKDKESMLLARQDELNEIINATSSTFLGVTVSCARCHNHKFDPVRQADYYSMQAVFAGVYYGERPLRKEDSPEQIQRIQSIEQRITQIDQRLVDLEPLAFTASTVIIDDEDTTRVTLLTPKTGHGTNPVGNARGQRHDLGDSGRAPNLSKGRYTWWDMQDAQDLIAYQPGVEGMYHVWLSWGCGWATHCTDAQYLLDNDGNLDTLDDRTLIATVDQQRFGDRTGDPVSQPLWSGLFDAGEHHLSSQSRIILRSGPAGGATTADVIVLQEATSTGSVGPLLRGPVNSRRNVERFTPVEAKTVRFTCTATNNVIAPCLDELEIFSEGKNVALASLGSIVRSSGNYADTSRHRLEQINDGQYGNEKSWISDKDGFGRVEIELPQVMTIDSIRWGRDLTGRFEDRTPVEYRIEVAARPGEWVTVAGSSDRLLYDTPHSPGNPFTSRLLPEGQRDSAAALSKERKQLADELGKLRAGQSAFAGIFRPAGETHRLYRGDPSAPREIVNADIPAVFGSLDLSSDAPEQNRRAEFAKWLSSADNPLTARVMVNRIWQHHFGTGIVDSPSDFGAMGTKPSHPALLDWLASEFVAKGWSIKNMHRLILTSQAYQQSNLPDPRALQIDADCRLLWRYPPRRLEAESIRDSILAVTGVLDLTMGGPGFSLFKPNTNYVRVYEPKEQWGPEDWRRMVYSHKVRMEREAVFGAFDCPDAGLPAPKRSRSTTPIQALNLFNSPFILQQSQLLAERATRESDDDMAVQIRRAFLLTLSRHPDPVEEKRCMEVAQQDGLQAVCRALLNTNEFLFIP